MLAHLWWPTGSLWQRRRIQCAKYPILKISVFDRNCIAPRSSSSSDDQLYNLRLIIFIEMSISLLKMCAKYSPIFTASSAANNYFVQFHCSKFVLNIHKYSSIFTRNIVPPDWDLACNHFCGDQLCDGHQLWWLHQDLQVLSFVFLLIKCNDDDAWCQEVFGGIKGGPWGSKGPRGSPLGAWGS